ncbi:conserved hypothetical protein [Planktothrix serta PCC 8927]|uniref:HepT-like domain-containing protein n=1 Tax=Planktothrix serta PCC 8927 TaxID=671068 RepID=A0A7Z9E0S2_9CYAN|nr:hypothetical protein [Planktothrix serta]VXD21758.1 conserved hypothetical protein [Planktothrix serta PCC 8927]
MKPMSASKIRELATDIEIELERLGRLELAIAQVHEEIRRDPERSAIFYESLALKLHNFYTGCERIFQLIVSELNGSLPSSFDWHKRLLNRMSIEREGLPAVLTSDTVVRLNEYLGFRHIVRNLYGFELDPNRLEKLVEHYPTVWHQVNFELREFINWLRQLSEQLE